VELRDFREEKDGSNSREARTPLEENQCRGIGHEQRKARRRGWFGWGWGGRGVKAQCIVAREMHKRFDALYKEEMKTFGVLEDGRGRTSRPENLLWKKTSVD